ncbi:hypothetical protein EZV62_010596 [Acer yangbiense]|uniref:K-box domain-containing protein n=1 Tax=Acer yangbiense TaxID=1000413 RepID=A0A5C7I528_9ROSI|nr:hypothetical protein EZV62_010596 [Acer yangbiense]
MAKPVARAFQSKGFLSPYEGEPLVDWPHSSPVFRIGMPSETYKTKRKLRICLSRLSRTAFLLVGPSSPPFQLNSEASSAPLKLTSWFLLFISDSLLKLQSWYQEVTKLKAEVESLQRTQRLTIVSLKNAFKLRYLLGEDLGTLSVEELQNLENQLEGALALARQRKVQLYDHYMYACDRHLEDLNMQLKIELEIEGQTLEAIQGLWGSGATAGNNSFPVLSSHDTFMNCEAEPVLQLGDYHFVQAKGSSVGSSETQPMAGHETDFIQEIIYFDEPDIPIQAHYVEAKRQALVPYRPPKAKYPEIIGSSKKQRVDPKDATLEKNGLVVCFGEILLIDFVPMEYGVSLAEAFGFKKAAGGAPANTEFKGKDEKKLRETLLFANACGALTVTLKGTIVKDT